MMTLLKYSVSYRISFLSVLNTMFSNHNAYYENNIILGLVFHNSKHKNTHIYIYIIYQKLGDS